MTDEKIMSGYNPEIMRRLFRFLKPYRLAVIVSLLGLIVATAGELYLPVIMQRAIDNELVVNYVRVPADKADTALPESIKSAWVAHVGEYDYVLESKLNRLGGVNRRNLEKQGLLSTRTYYVFPNKGVDFNALSSRYGNVFISGTDQSAVPTSDLSRFSTADRRKLRHSDLVGLATRAKRFFGVLVAILIFTFFQVYFLAYTGQGVMKDLRMMLFGHTIRQSLSFLNRMPIGRLVTRITNDVETINELFTTVLATLIKNLATMVGVIVTLFLLSRPMGVVATLTLPPVVVATVFFRTRARDAFRRVRHWVSQVNAFLSEHISGMSVVQMFVQENRVGNRFRKQNTELMKANLTEMYVFATFRPIIDLLSSTSIAAVIYFGGYFVLRSLVSVGVLVAFINLVRRFYRQVMDISEKFVVLQSAMAGSERVFNLLDQTERIADEGTHPVPSHVRGEVVFDHVRFAYKEDEPVLKDLSFRVNPGETVAIVGYTGAGKTTIASLLTRLWDVQAGRILVDGTDIRSYPLTGLRKTIQPIQQDVFLFHETILENVRLGADIPREQVVQAAQVVQADGFISGMSRAYDTDLEEGAVNISTGQRQLLSFARVIAHDPRIIILDEATSSVDTETERLIQKGLSELLKGRTSLVIAHRLSTIKHADRILVLSSGEVVEEGTHNELLDLKGVYYNLYKLQFLEEAEA